jgi:uncharacterized protein (DUF2336 family)
MASRLIDLIALAKEPSSERRRELLRELTEIFFVTPQAHGPEEAALFDAVMTKLATEMEEAVRAELAVRMSAEEDPPRTLIKSLAFDVIDVAAPVLRRSPALSEADLVAIATTKGQGHLRAVARRETLSEGVSELIVNRGDDQTLEVLLRNDGARLSRTAHETAVDRAQANPMLHEAIVDRASLPIDLLNEMYFVVEARLRGQILARNADVDPAELDRALSAGRKRVASLDGALPIDFPVAEKAVRALLAKKAVTPPVLAGMLRAGETTKFLISLAELAEVDFHTARSILERREIDALAVICKAADFDRPLFLTFAVLILDKEAGAMGRAREYANLYNDLPREAAQRTLRFWRLRRSTIEQAA